MNNNYAFYNWFQKIISICIDIFFVAAPIATLYVFTSPFNGAIKYLVFALLVAVYLLVIYFFKDRIRILINMILKSFEKVDEKRMLLILIVLMIVLKVIFTILFSYDATSDGDIEIYNEIANQIIQSGELHSTAISHLYGVALHFVLFRLLGIPLHIGMFVVILAGVIVSFFAFKDIIGKEKAFFILLAYVAMPSTSMMSFSATHEVFVFMYVSIFLYSFNKIFKKHDLYGLFFSVAVAILSASLTCLVNPGGYILYVIMILCAILTNIPNKKRVLVLVVLVLTIILNNGVSKLLDIDEHNTLMNTYTILIHGSNPESLGEQVDGYPHKEMRMYIYEYDLKFTKENFIYSAQQVLLRQYKYLLMHPSNLLALIVHKFYILWSGVHYPLEYAHHFGIFNNITLNMLLVINALIYLFVITIGLVYRDSRKKSNLFISNYELELLGVVALTLLCIVVNKYSLYATVFIYLISLFRSNIYEK